MIRLQHDNDTGFGDFIKGDFGLESDEGLESLVYMMLFTDARADESDDIPDGTDDPRGWWGETYGYGFGSKLWLLSRSKTTTRNLRKAEQFARDALRPLIRWGVAREVSITAQRWKGDRLLLTVQIVKPDGTQWSRKWDNQGNSTTGQNAVGAP